MSKQIKIRWGILNYPDNEYELTVGLNDEPDSNYYSISLGSIETAASGAVNGLRLPQGGSWDLNYIYDVIDAPNNNMYREDEKIYIKKGFDEEKGDQDNTEFPFGDARLEYFIPASNNNDSSDDDVTGDGFVVGGVKRKRTRHTFVGTRVSSPVPPLSKQSPFYKKTKSNIEKATADFLKEEADFLNDEKERQKNRLPFTPDEEDLIMEATKSKKGGGKSLLKKKRTKSLLKKKRTKKKKRGYGGKSPKKRGRKSPKKRGRKSPKTKKKRGYGGKSPKKRGRKSTKRRRH